MSDLRPRRSVLYMPAANERALDKAKGIPADALIFDLEDAVAPAKKYEARFVVRNALRALDYNVKERITGLDSTKRLNQLLIFIKQS